MPPSQGSVAEYLSSLKKSPSFGPQVVAHKHYAPSQSNYPPVQGLDHGLVKRLGKLGIEGLYSHQQEAIEHILQGRHVVVATPTASGKSLIYNIPVFQTLLQDPGAKALYLFPLKALAQDQVKTLTNLADQSGISQSLCIQQLAAIYDGDTSSYFRKKIRNNLPAILVTNPDMLHLSLLPYHANWGHLYSNLRYIIIDEVHAYRGIFGSHVAWVMKRLLRICKLYGATPTFILSSATIGNPDELASKLTGQEFQKITHSGAGRAARNFLLLNPLESAAASAAQLLEAAIHRGLRTIVYTQSRKMTELITMWTDKRLGAKSGCIASYRAGFLPEDRRKLETRLSSGDLLGVISTSALELGIDIGNLDICILVGYPGSIMATWQRAGRVGRAERESLVILLGNEDALDQYFMRNPEDFFSRKPEQVVLNPENKIITKKHLVCAAAEIPIDRETDILYQTNASQLEDLAFESSLLQSSDGSTWFSTRKYPQRDVDLRGSGRQLQILEKHTRKLLGTLDAGRALKECHAGAIYLHMARTWHVDTLDLDAGVVLVSPLSPSYFTRVTTNKQIEILNITHSKTYGETRVHLGPLRVTEHITGYKKIQEKTMRTIAKYPLDFPPQIFETEGLWVQIPEEIQDQSTAGQYHFMGGIHALEHAMIGVMPLVVLCDRNDIGGISHPFHDQLEGPGVFIYDGYSGGMGLCSQAYNRFSHLMEQTNRAVSTCPCEIGCPSCVHSPKCGSGNRPIDKRACLMVIEGLKQQHTPGRKQGVDPVVKTVFPKKKSPQEKENTLFIPEAFGVFDLETQKSAQDVGGWHNADRMLISVAVLYDSRTDQYHHFTENQVDQLINQLFSLELVVGFNNKRFDNKVLSAYTGKDLFKIPTLDILEEITNQLGYRLSLDRLAEKTLKIKKSGNGLQALKWYRQGEMNKLSEYCQMDVEITRDLFLFGLRQRYLLFQNKAGQEVRLPVRFNQTIARLLEISN